MPSGKIKIGSRAFSASQVGTLYGCGYNTMLGLYNKYKGINTPAAELSKEAQESMEFGTFFEDAVAKYFANKMGFRIKKCGETAYWASDMPYFICHPDRLVIGKDSQGRRVALEIKCVRPFAEGWGETGTTEIPDVYFFQVQSYFACQVPCDVVYVVCMRGNRIYSYEILPDNEIIADIRYRVAKTKEDFDHAIVPDSENYEDAFNYYASKVNKEAEGIGANDEVLAKFNELLRIHSEKDTLTKEENKVKEELMKALGEHPAFVVTEEKKVKRIVYWSQETRIKVDDKKLEKEHPEIKMSDYRTESIVRKFKIAYPQKKEAKNG